MQSFVWSSRSVGWSYLGFPGDENVLTPDMDILAEGGAVFECAHATANHCHPTLQTLTSGLYSHQYTDISEVIAEERLQGEPLPTGVETARDRTVLRQQYVTSASENSRTLPPMLSEVGCTSHQSGKWWEQIYAHGGLSEGMTGSWSWKDAADLGDQWFFTFMGGQGMDIGRETMAPVTDFIK